MQHLLKSLLPPEGGEHLQIPSEGRKLFRVVSYACQFRVANFSQVRIPSLPPRCKYQLAWRSVMRAHSPPAHFTPAAVHLCFNSRTLNSRVSSWATEEYCSTLEKCMYSASFQIATVWKMQSSKLHCALLQHQQAKRLCAMSAAQNTQALTHNFTSTWRPHVLPLQRMTSASMCTNSEVRAWKLKNRETPTLSELV